MTEPVSANAAWTMASGTRDGVLLRQARDFVAGYFDAIDRTDLARMVWEGAADDFAEVRAATGLFMAREDMIARYEGGLGQYADPAFWEALWLTTLRQNLLKTIFASLVMGLAICGMHYAGMRAATFNQRDSSTQTRGIGSGHDDIMPGSATM